MTFNAGRQRERESWWHLDSTTTAPSPDSHFYTKNRILPSSTHLKACTESQNKIQTNKTFNIDRIQRQQNKRIRKMNCTCHSPTYKSHVVEWGERSIDQPMSKLQETRRSANFLYPPSNEGKKLACVLKCSVT